MNEAVKVPPGHEPLRPEAAAQQPPPQPSPLDEGPVDLGVEGVEGEPARPLTPEEEAVDDPLAHPLSKPIEAHGEQVTILRWREPTGFDIEKAGNPIVVETSPGGDRLRVTFDEKKMSAMISQLSKVPPHSVRSLVARDWNAVAFKVFRFFM